MESLSAVCLSQARADLLPEGEKCVPPAGFEPATHRLVVNCHTTTLEGQPSKQGKVVEKMGERRGLERNLYWDSRSRARVGISEQIPKHVGEKPPLRASTNINKIIITYYEMNIFLGEESSFLNEAKASININSAALLALVACKGQ